MPVSASEPDSAHPCFSFCSKMGRWSESTTIKFVKVYCSLNCLWDTSDPEYKNHQLRAEALQQLVVAMNMANFDISEARTKVKSLRNTYLLELKKIERAKRLNEVYIPSLKWFDIMDTALKTTKQTSGSGSNSSNVVPFSMSSEQESFAFDGDEDDEVILEESPMELPSTTTTALSISELEEAWSGASARKRPRQAFEDPLAEQYHSRRPTPAEEDEFETFGKYMAQALKNMPIHLALQCQNELQTTMTRFRFMSLGAFECEQGSSSGHLETEVQDPIIKTENFEEVLLM